MIEEVKPLMREVIAKVIEGEDLKKEEASRVMEEMMKGLVTPSQLAAYLTSLRCKGETVEEITGSAEVMRSFATPIQPESRPLIDTCGTGGDGQGTFNISTTAAFVVAAGGMRVAKHGNRSLSSKSGSADLLEELGVNINLTIEEIEESIDTVGIGFLFAPHLHPAMAHAMQTRKELGIRTLFNLLGPLTNPASCEYQTIGVYEKRWVKPLAYALKELGVKGALVFHGASGLDELSTTGENFIAQVEGDVVHQFSLRPEDVGLRRVSLQKIKGGSPRENGDLTREILSGREGPPLDIVLLNAGAAFFTGERVSSLKEGIVLSQEVVASGKALEMLDSLIAFTQGLKR